MIGTHELQIFMALPTFLCSVLSACLDSLWSLNGRKAIQAKSFQDFQSHRILRHMHKTLNIDESKN